MKIRLYKDSVRLRISPSELSQLSDGNTINESFNWPGTGNSKLQFSIIPGDGPLAHADMSSGSYSIRIGIQRLKDWEASDEVGIYDKLSLPEQGSLSISIEKDFECKGRDSEDKTDRFTNPNEVKC